MCVTSFSARALWLSVSGFLPWVRETGSESVQVTSKPFNFMVGGRLECSQDEWSTITMCLVNQNSAHSYHSII